MKLPEWLDAAARAAHEIASGPLGAIELHWSGPSRAPLPEDLSGVYLPLLLDGLALQLGVLATQDVCLELARALLGDPEHVFDCEEDVFDAVGEITNMIAGNLKVLLVDERNVRVGVPLAMRGRVFSLGGSQSVHGLLSVDQREVWLVLSGNKLD